MNQNYLIVEMKRIQPVHFHQVLDPKSPLEAYNTGRSFATFQKLTLHVPNALLNMNRWFRVWDWRDLKGQTMYGYETSVFKHLATPEGSKLFVRHDTLWDFYKHIGYDHKKQSFV